MSGQAIPTLCAFALLFAVAALLLREFGFRGAPIFAAFAGVALLSGYFGRLSGGLRELFAFADRAGISDAAADAAKVLGLGALASLTADVCEDLGERGIARAVVLAARAEIFLLVLPYFSEAVGIGLSLLEEGIVG